MLIAGEVVEVFVGEGGERGGGGGEEGVGDGADGVGAVVGVFAAGGEGLVLGGEGAAEGGGDGGGVAGAVEHGGAAEPALLAGADVDGGNAQRGHFDDAARGVADHGSGVSHGGEVAYHAEGFDDEDAVGALGGEGADALDYWLAAGVVVGVGDNGAEAGNGVEGFEHGDDAFFGAGDGVERGHDGASGRELEAEVGFEFGERHKRLVEDVPHAEGAGVDDARGVFAHLYHAAAVGFGGGEMEGGEFGDGVADVVVDGSFAHLAAGDVGNGDGHHCCRRRYGEHLVAVAEHYEHVGGEPTEGLCRAVHARGHGADACGLALAFEGHGHARANDEALTLDFVDSHAIFRHQVHVGGENLQLYAGPAAQFGGQGREQPPVGACGCGDADFHI